MHWLLICRPTRKQLIQTIANVRDKKVRVDNEEFIPDMVAYEVIIPDRDQQLFALVFTNSFTVRISLDKL